MRDEETVQFRKFLKFEAVDLTKYDANLFVTTDPVKRNLNGFILGLAAAYNDLVTIVWYDQIIATVAPISSEPNSLVGQCSGHFIFNMRQLITVFSEMIETLRNNKELIRHPDFVEALRRTRSDTKPRWNEVLQHINYENNGEQKSLAARALKFAKDVRNSVVSHYYYGENFYSGYEKWLSQKVPSNTHIYASLGNNTVTSRFYIADGAIESYLNIAYQRHGINKEELIKFVNNFNFSLRFIINSYLDYESALKGVSVERSY